MSDKINVLLTSFEQFYKYKYNPTISVSEKVKEIFKDSNIINISTNTSHIMLNNKNTKC